MILEINKTEQLNGVETSTILISKGILCVQALLAVVLASFTMKYLRICNHFYTCYGIIQL